MTKNVFSFDNVCKIQSLWHACLKYGLTTWPDVTQDCNSIFMQLLIRPGARVWDTSNNQFRSWHIWHNYVTNLTNSDWLHSRHTKMLYLCPMSISISVPFTPHLPHLEEVDLRLCCECQKNTNRHYSTRPLYVFRLQFQFILSINVACMRLSVCCGVIVVMSVPWSMPGLGSLNKVMRSKLNSAMSVPVSAGSLPSAHTGTRSHSRLAIFSYETQRTLSDSLDSLFEFKRV